MFGDVRLNSAMKKKVASKTLVGGAISVKCISNCFKLKQLTSAAAPCVAYSIQNNWSATELSTTIYIPANASFEAAFQGFSLLLYYFMNFASFEGSAWIAGLGVGANGGWSVSTAISTIPRFDGMTITIIYE